VARAIPDPGFAGDDGGADPALAAALRERSAGRTTDSAVLAALVRARLLVPVVAVLGDEDAAPALRREKHTDMALVTLIGADGRRAVPAFTSLASLARWNRDARPVPVAAERAGQTALADGHELLVLDPAGPATYLVEGPALRALAEGRVQVPPIEDPDVAAAVRSAAGGEDGLAAVYVLPGRDSDVTVALVLSAGTGADAAGAIVARLAARLAEDPVLRARLDRGMDLAVLPAGSAPGGLDVLARTAAQPDRPR